MNHELACQEEPRERVSMFRVLSIPNLHELAVATLILANHLTPGVDRQLSSLSTGHVSIFPLSSLLASMSCRERAHV